MVKITPEMQEEILEAHYNTIKEITKYTKH
jgi:hypothetical protein